MSDYLSEQCLEIVSDEGCMKFATVLIGFGIFVYFWIETGSFLGLLLLAPLVAMLIGLFGVMPAIFLLFVAETIARTIAKACPIEK
jgi:hypothetical protein